MRRLPAATVMLALAIAGCGSTSSSDEAKSTVESYYRNLAASNGTQVCDEIAPALKQKIEKGGAHTCAEQASATGKLLTPASIEKLKKAKVESVTVSGEHATATVGSGSGSPATVKLVKTSSGWKIESVSGAIS